ncbi:MAG TPA: hypothetical protein VN515_06715 [Terriglobales bacterium]|nr:hypothetical protein [Terriglobales bacterium]
MTPRRQRRLEKTAATWPAVQGWFTSGDVLPLGSRLYRASFQFGYDSGGLQAGTFFRLYIDDAEARRDFRALRDRPLIVHVNPADPASSCVLWAEHEPILAAAPPLVPEMEPIGAGLVRTTLAWAALGLAASLMLLIDGFGLIAWSRSLWLLGALLAGGFAIYVPTRLLRLKLASTSRRPGTRAGVPSWQRWAWAAGGALACAVFLRYSWQLRAMPMDAEIPDAFFDKWLGDGVAWAYSFALVVALQAARYAPQTHVVAD